MGGLRTSMATCGYRDIAEFNRAELMVAPALQTEGKHLQREQGVGMGREGSRRRCRRLAGGCKPAPVCVIGRSRAFARVAPCFLDRLGFRRRRMTRVASKFVRPAASLGRPSR